MSQDVVDLRSFYASRLGETARRFVLRIIRERWDNCAGLSVLGVGYATPYLDLFRGEAMRTLAFMPAETGVVAWPPGERSAAALVETTALPLPDACIDRLLLVHALETEEHPRQLLSEIWRVLTPGGRVIVVAPNRRGLWARFDTTPFGNGRPYSRGQLRDLLRDCLFSPLHAGEALYMPPSSNRLVLRAAPMFERFGAGLGLPGAGVLAAEAAKQLYRPVAARRSVRQAMPQMQGALVPSGGRARAMEPALSQLGRAASAKLTQDAG